MGKNGTKRSKKGIKFEGGLKFEKAALYLETLVASLREHALTVDSGSELLVKRAKGPLKVEVRGRDKGKRGSLVIKLKWKEADLRAASKRAAALEPSILDPAEHEVETAPDSPAPEHYAG